MRRNASLLIAVLLVACGRTDEPPRAAKVAKLNTFDVDQPAPGAAAGPKIVAGPRISYTYAVTYSFDQRTVARVQGQQLALCRQLGPARCVVVKSTLNAPGPGDHFASDEAVLLVDARVVGAVNRRLDALATSGGAALATRQVEADDVTREVIDTDARVRAKQALANRLLAIIQSGKGRIGELVEAERAYAATQAELDAARGEQADLARRVAMSRVTISYVFNDLPGRVSPIRGSLATAGETFASSIAMLVTAAVAIVPWVIVGTVVLGLARWVRRRLRWRWPRRA